MATAAATAPPAVAPTRRDRWVAAGRDLLRRLSPRSAWAALKSGRATPDQRRAAVGRVIDDGKVALVAVCRSFADRLPAGFGWLAGWLREFADAMAPRHYAAAMAALADPALTPADLEGVDAAVAAQLAWLAGFRADLKAGRCPAVAPDAAGHPATSPAFRARAALYASACWGTSQEAARARVVAAKGEERRKLSGGERTCRGCRSEAAKGWRPAGTLAPIGSQQCRSNCRCYWEFRVAASKPASAPLGGRPAPRTKP